MRESKDKEKDDNLNVNVYHTKQPKCKLEVNKENSEEKTTVSTDPFA